MYAIRCWTCATQPPWPGGAGECVQVSVCSVYHTHARKGDVGFQSRPEEQALVTDHLGGDYMYMCAYVQTNTQTHTLMYKYDRHTHT